MNLAALHVTHSMMISGGAWNEVSWGDKDLFCALSFPSNPYSLLPPLVALNLTACTRDFDTVYGLMALDLPFAMAPMQHSGLAREHFIPSFDPCEHTMLHVSPSFVYSPLFTHKRQTDG